MLIIGFVNVNPQCVSLPMRLCPAMLDLKVGYSRLALGGAVRAAWGVPPYNLLFMSAQASGGMIEVAGSTSMRCVDPWRLFRSSIAVAPMILQKIPAYGVRLWVTYRTCFENRLRALAQMALLYEINLDTALRVRFDSSLMRLENTLNLGPEASPGARSQCGGRGRAGGDYPSAGMRRPRWS